MCVCVMNVHVNTPDFNIHVLTDIGKKGFCYESMFYMEKTDLPEQDIVSSET